jgi:hypothetical protein
MSSSIVNWIRLRFAWVKHAPYTFANVSIPAVAKSILDEWEERGEEHQHRVTRHLIHTLKADIEVVANGGEASPELLAEQRIFRTMPLNEAPIEGYHAEVAKVTQRAHAGKAPYVFAEIRMDTNMVRLRRWCEKPGGSAVVAYEWARFKRVIRLDLTMRSPKIKVKAFLSFFYRLRDEAVGPIHTLTKQWAHRLGPSLQERSMATKLKQEYTSKLLEVTCFYTLPGLDSSVQCFVVLRKCTGMEKVVDVGKADDLRDHHVLQMYSVWRSEGGEGYPPNIMTVVPDLEPTTVVVWQLVETWTQFREGLRVWKSSESDTVGCIDLSQPKVVDSCSIDDDKCPTVLLLEELRSRGWVAQESVVTHTHASKVYSCSGVWTRSEYLRVLLKWDIVFNHIASMKSNLPKTYYQCLLRDIAVPPGEKSKFYANVLKANGVAAAEELDALEDEAEAVVQERQALADDEAPPLQDEDAVQEDCEQELLQAIGESSSSSSSSSSSGDEAPGAPGAPVAPAAPDVVQAGDEWPSVIDGAHVKSDTYVGAHQAYHRLIVSCQHHVGCLRKHNTGLRQTATLGKREPLAFLAVWHQGGIGRSKAQHRDFYPTLAAMQAWLDANPAV